MSDIIDIMTRAETVDSFKFGSCETLFALIHVGDKQPTLLALAYARARARGMKKIKVAFAKPLQAAEFFEEALPKAGVTTDVFAVVDNADLQLKDAELVLVDQAEKLKADEISAIADCVYKSKAPVIITSHSSTLAVRSVIGTAPESAPMKALLARIVYCKNE